jgi:hypothetical protein
MDRSLAGMPRGLSPSRSANQTARRRVYFYSAIALLNLVVVSLRKAMACAVISLDKCHRHIRPKTICEEEQSRTIRQGVIEAKYERCRFA